MIDTEVIEKGLLAIVANWTGLTPEAEIFRGKIPDGLTSGVAVAILDDPSGNDPQVPERNAQVIVKRGSRDGARSVVDALLNRLPSFGPSGNGVRFLGVLKAGGGAIVQVDDGGAKSFQSTVKLLLQMSPTGADLGYQDGNYFAPTIQPYVYQVVYPAAEIIHGHRAVRIMADGVHHASSAALAHAQGVAGISMNAAAVGDAVTVRIMGQINEPSWSWIDGSSVYVGVDGVLTQTPPTSGYIREIGIAVGPKSMIVRTLMPVRATC
jgi:hypothetical protein